MTRSDEEPTSSAAFPPETARPDQGTPDQGTPDQGAPDGDAAPEVRPTAGVRWSDGPAASPSSSPRRDDDATPPSGLGTPGPGTPGRTTAVAPAPNPGWSGAQPGPGQQTAPGWAPPPPRDPARARRTRRIVLAVVLGVVVLAAVVVALLAFLVGPRFARYDVLDRAAVERGVTDVVTRDWRRPATGASCPDDVRVRPGASFACTVTVEGRPQQVPVDVVDEAGTYEVGQPR